MGPGGQRCDAALRRTLLGLHVRAEHVAIGLVALVVAVREAGIAFGCRLKRGPSTIF